MPYASIAGLSVLSGRLVLPRVGVWQAAAMLDSDNAPSGRVSLSWGGLSWSGTVVRAGSNAGSVSVRVLGGNGGLGTTVTAQGFVDVKVRSVVNHIASAAGETLASDIDSSLLDLELSHYAVSKSSAGTALVALEDVLDCSWRFLPNGSLWVGRESWIASETPCEFLAADGLSESIEASMPIPSLLPGSTLQGRRVSRVEHTVQPACIRSRIWLERAEASR